MIVDAEYRGWRWWNTRHNRERNYGGWEQWISAEFMHPDGRNVVGTGQTIEEAVASAKSSVDYREDHQEPLTIRTVDASDSGIPF